MPITIFFIIPTPKTSHAIKATSLPIENTSPHNRFSKLPYIIEEPINVKIYAEI